MTRARRLGTILSSIAVVGIAVAVAVVTTPAYAEDGHRGGHRGSHASHRGGHQGSRHGSHLSIGLGGHHGSHSGLHLSIGLGGRHGYSGHSSYRYYPSYSYRHRYGYHAPYYRYPIYSRYHYVSPAYRSYSSTRYVIVDDDPGRYEARVIYGSQQPYPRTTDGRVADPYAGTGSTEQGMHAVDSPGWGLLAADRPADALSVFANEAQRNPTRGMPKLGYALAAAQLGDLDKGVWAMRRALRYDPDALHYFTAGQQLRPKIHHLIGRYENRLESASYNPDAAFMLAALHYLVRDTDAARAAINLAIRQADRSSSAANLKRLIDAEYPADAPQ